MTFLFVRVVLDDVSIIRTHVASVNFKRDQVWYAFNSQRVAQLVTDPHVTIQVFEFENTPQQGI